MHLSPCPRTSLFFLSCHGYLFAGRSVTRPNGTTAKAGPEPQSARKAAKVGMKPGTILGIAASTDNLRITFTAMTTRNNKTTQHEHRRTAPSSSSSSRFSDRKLNPAFVAAHGLNPSDDINVSNSSSSSNSSSNRTKKALDNALDQARLSGKLQLVNLGLSSPLPDSIFQFRNTGTATTVDYSNSNDGFKSWECHAEETLTLVDISDNPGVTELDARWNRFVQLRTLRARRCGLVAVSLSTNWEFLTVLDLAGNSWKGAFPFKSLVPKFIREVYLSDNQISSLVKDEGEGKDGDDNTAPVVEFPQLIVLDISENLIRSLPPTLQFPKLQRLHCSHNELTELVGCLLCAKHSLTVLEAHHNQLGVAATTSETGAASVLDFTKFLKLKTLNLSFNHLTNVPTVSLSLQRLMLEQNSISSADSLFQSNSISASSSSLVELRLANNQFSDLSSVTSISTMDSTSLFQTLQLLDLRFNYLRDLPYQVGFYPNLQHILLQGNPSIRGIKDEYIQNNNTASILQILKNRRPSRDDEKGQTNNSGSATTVRESLAATSILNRMLLHNGKTLNMQQQQWKAIPNNVLQDLQAMPPYATNRIESWLLNRNELTEIDVACFQRMPNLVTLEINRNGLKSLPPLGNHLHQLKQLSLARNGLTCAALDNHTFPSTSLTHLDLSSNRLDQVPPVVYGLKVLRVLSLASNRITSLEAWAEAASTTMTTTAPTPKLEVLDLSGNQISHLGDFPFTIVSTMSQLRSLQLQNNQLSQIPLALGMIGGMSHSNSSVTSLHCLDLRGNPQRAIRYSVLEKTNNPSSILDYLRNRMTPRQLEEAKTKLEKYRSGKPEQQTKEVGRETKLEPSPASSVPPEGVKKRSSLSSSRTTVPTLKPSNPAVLATQPVDKQRSEPDPVPAPSPSALLEELRTKMTELTQQLDKPNLSRAKRYALKKQLAMERSRFIREERRLQQQSEQQ